MRAGLWAVALLVLGPSGASAEWQIKPFFGVSFAGSTTFVTVEDAAGGPNVMFGASGGLLGEIFGLDVDFGYGPGFFEAGDQSLVLSSGVTTLTGSIVVAVPRRMADVGLRPYFVGGGGLMHVWSNHSLDVLRIERTLPALNLGGGATGFLTDRIGLNWELRYFRSVGGEERGLSFGREELSFWRARMAVAIRY